MNIFLCKESHSTGRNYTIDLKSDQEFKDWKNTLSIVLGKANQQSDRFLGCTEANRDNRANIYIYIFFFLILFAVVLQDKDVSVVQFYTHFHEVQVQVLVQVYC